MQTFTQYIKNTISIRHINFTLSKLFLQTNSCTPWNICTVQHIGCRAIALGAIHWMLRNYFIELKEGLSI